MKSIVIAIALLVVCATHTSAQVLFSQPLVVNSAQAQTFEYKLYQTTPTLPLPTVVTFFLVATCTGTAPNISCTAPTPATLSKVTGVKFELTARDTVNNTTESMKSNSFTFPAVAPTNLSVTP